MKALWVTVWMAKLKELHLCVFYKPPSAPASRFDHLLKTILKIFDKNKKCHPNIVIASDFNCGDISWTTDPPSVTNHKTAPLMNCLLDFGNNNALTQHLLKPTRLASLKTLDLVLSSKPLPGSVFQTIAHI